MLQNRQTMKLSVSRSLALLPLLVLPLMGAAGCSVAQGDSGDSASADTTAAPPWNTEAEVANVADYRKTVNGYFSAHVSTKSFTSTRPKTHKTRQGDDVTIAFGVARPDANVPEKGVVVLVNGRTESFMNYAELVYDLGRRGYTLYMID